MRIILYYDTQFSRENREELGLEILLDYDNFSILEITSDQKDTLLSQNATLQEFPDLDQIFFGGKLLNKDQLKFSGGSGNQKITWILQFNGPIKEEWIMILKEEGVQLFGHIYPFATFAYMDTSLAARIAHTNYQLHGEKAIAWLGRYDKQSKISASEEDDEVVIHYFPWADKSKKKDLKKNQTPAQKLELAESEGVLLIEPHFIPTLSNSDSRLIIKSDICHDIGSIGTDQTIAITDTGIYRTHEAFSKAGKIAAIIDVAGDSNQYGGDGYGHGTHVAGSAAGQSAPYTSYSKDDGQAFGSKLIDVKVFNNYGYWAGGSSDYLFWNNAYLSGARINNNSWGAATQGSYTSSDQDADQICQERPDYILAIAAGNAGPSASSLNSPAGSKNALSIGSVQTQNPENLSSFSGRGPTHDSRIKPDLVAPGELITSAQTQTTSGYVQYQGTSMATPQVAGLSALIRQHFKDNFLTDPSSALVKALLINGAEEITGTGSDSLNEGKFPNNSQGWGRVNLERALPTSGDRDITYWDQLMAPLTGQIWSSNLEVGSNAEEVKFTLVWRDAPGTVGSSVDLVNNLNLRIIAPDGKIFYGNNFTGLNPGYSVTGGSLDSRNNVEGVHLYSQSFGGPIPSGTYQIDVISANMTIQNNGFALVAGIVSSEAPPPPPPPPPVTNKVAVIGDYNSQIQNVLLAEGYEVDAYSRTGYSGLDPSLYNAIVINKASSDSYFDGLINSGTGIVLLGPYPKSQSGVGILSTRTFNPALASAYWGNGPVKTQILQSHPIFENHSVGEILTLNNGGDNDYHGFSSLNPGQDLGSNQNSGYPTLIAINSNLILIGGLGASYYTGTSHWTADGLSLFKASVNYATTL